MDKGIVMAGLLAAETIGPEKPAEPNYTTEQPLPPDENKETAPETEISGRRKFQFGKGMVPKSLRPPHGVKPESQMGK